MAPIAQTLVNDSTDCSSDDTVVVLVNAVSRVVVDVLVWIVVIV